MNRLTKYTLRICLAAGIFAAGYVAPRPPASGVSAPPMLYYTCPMHPQYKSGRPGTAPCCGMTLVPVYARTDSATPAGLVQLGAARQQLMGVRTDEVRRTAASQILRVPGRIAVDDSRLYRLIAAADGWILELGPNTAGTFVKKDEILASYYTPNLQAAQQSFLFSFATGNQLEREEIALGTLRAPTSVNLQAAIDSLRSLGMNDLQIEELRRTRKYASRIHIYSPVTGFVIARQVSPAQRFDKGTELYRIADIGHLWVMTDLFEKDRAFSRAGAIALVRYEGREYRAVMSDVLPQFDPQSRTLKTRFELDNPGYILRPDMFVDADLCVDRPAAITVPADALIDTGRRKTVFVECGSGCFAPRAVETGWRLGGRVEITAGLEPGERIVVSGTFMLDSESRMQLATASTAVRRAKLSTEVDPVCGMDVDTQARDALTTRHSGRTYFFCSLRCKQSFEASPGKYLGPD